MNTYRLLAIHAHPDDESSKGAATMARYIDEGHRVKVLTCTGGERGDILNPSMEPVEDIVPVRKEEMAKAAGILGVEHEWLGYVDSGLPEGDPPPPLPDGCFALEDTDEVTQRVVKVVRDFRPHVIITYDENGGYPHPDHIKVHAVSMRAWEAAADPSYHPELGEPWEIKKLYYTHGFIRQRFELLADALAHRGVELPGSVVQFLSFTKRFPDILNRVTTRVNVGDWFERRDDALRAHATQVDPQGQFFIGDPDIQREIWPTEEFELAETRVHTELPEDDLFAGLASDDNA
ncbi:mycothiol conjugate amidase Mca [Corynebacterium auriscanis]|uniref:Mycothiol S-conjugate amidase n=1 Tax=Corynebacterium auriscanis TaxID=99807 RepID=A0A0A2DFV1_9CORY|nr:mycothiol conjugate amidase Mca [Corynebacterium auriscanis]KGM18035.1 GlcNAc-PI de-N-acetylase [Corynebacterium auriscanis]MCX2162367.1 mycothiol conjugate amidase Mca [Corynebacterium auriscanis]WJY73177.1 Mycothiol S-conjugate amidase [Corynebacterium auriscanis]